MKEFSKVEYNKELDWHEAKGPELKDRLYAIMRDPNRTISYSDLYYVMGSTVHYSNPKLREPSVYDMNNNYCDDGPPEGYYVPVKIVLDED